MTVGVETPSFWLRPEDVPHGWLAPLVGLFNLWTWGELNPLLGAPRMLKREPSLRPTDKWASRSDLIGFAGLFVFM